MISDSAGYFVIFVDRPRGLLNVEHYQNNGVLTTILVSGSDAALPGCVTGRSNPLSRNHQPVEAVRPSYSSTHPRDPLSSSAVASERNLDAQCSQECLRPTQAPDEHLLPSPAAEWRAPRGGLRILDTQEFSFSRTEAGASDLRSKGIDHVKKTEID
jgi:hypothetical protein